jgi:hypothetical protein
MLQKIQAVAHRKKLPGQHLAVPSTGPGSPARTPRRPRKRHARAKCVRPQINVEHPDYQIVW